MKIIKKSIIKEKVKAKHLLGLNFIYSCEDCSFFIPTKKLCNLGYNTKPHLKEQQDLLYHRTGRMALCRFLEID